MKKLLIFGIILCSLLSCRQKTGNLVWSDEFNYEGLPDETKWNSEEGFVRNNELQFYTRGRIENSVVKNGNLLIIGRKERFNGGEYTSASLDTRDKFFLKYGKIEARMKLPAGQGIRSALWMLGMNMPVAGWPECGEIDIMEHVNNTMEAVGTAQWYNEKPVSSVKSIPCDVTKYHNYAVEWNKDSIRWLIDDMRYHALCIQDSVNSTHEFHKSFYILLNLSIGGDWPKDPDSTTVFPDTLHVDWIRVYRDMN